MDDWLNNIDKRLADYKIVLAEVPRDFPRSGSGRSTKASRYGASPYNPGISCVAILKKKMFAKSGYYWVKSVCSFSPIRVFCDFESKKKQAYAYVNTSTKKITTIKDIEY